MNVLQEGKMKRSISEITRASGGFAILAIDQRESMRQMFAEYQGDRVSDEQLTEFKLQALRALTPFASAALIDKEFAWRRAIDERVVDPKCGRICSADRFISSADEIVFDVEIDETVDPEEARRDGAVGLKLLVPWRPDQPREKREALAEKFVRMCKKNELLSILEPVSKKPTDGRRWDHTAGIIAAAKELGNMGADLYKSEVPYHAKNNEKEVRRACAELSGAIGSPWVVLSSGVDPEVFPNAVEWACKEGASGFLAGRAIWRGVVGSPNHERALQSDAIPKLERLCEVVDRNVN